MEGCWGPNPSQPLPEYKTGSVFSTGNMDCAGNSIKIGHRVAFEWRGCNVTAAVTELIAETETGNTLVCFDAGPCAVGHIYSFRCSAV